ncbi:G-type lectin S-receptor serine/threonine-protein kinase [Spatholobus suberectus]|nr:G-type lectin S-receptor serine/threonine-protein kinase [Spatholobus suberectus]
MAFRNRILCFITFTCLLQLTNPSNLNGDTLLQGHQITITDSLISSSGMFTLSFFQFDKSEDFYLGIRLSVSANSSSYYWIANRDKPIHDHAGVLTIDQYGSLKIVSNGGNSTIVLYFADAASNNSISAVLQDAGNFVLREMNPDGTVKRELWQSFDYLTDTIIPGMKLGSTTAPGRQIYFIRSGKAKMRKNRNNLLSDIGRNTAISIAYGERREKRKDEETSDETYIFDFQTILEATANFSSTNKIGEGGFGPVYKGKLPNGQEIAIKRLSKGSGQGLNEFKNEAMLIVKLQHTNLVRLLGFCIDKEERILVYEYMPNKSLNLYLFGIEIYSFSVSFTF